MSGRPPQPPPDADSLRQAALRYLARYATTEAGLRLILQRKIDRWQRETSDREGAAPARAAISAIVAGMTELGLLNDAAFAESRAQRLALTGRSRRAIAARLMSKGIGAEQARAVPPVDELISALILARRRRIGPFRGDGEPDRDKELGVLARAGFPRDVALRALRMDPDEAGEAIRAAQT